MNAIYCSKCGLKLNLTRKAYPKHGIVVDLVDPHECLEIPIEPEVLAKSPRFEVFGEEPARLPYKGRFDPRGISSGPKPGMLDSEGLKDRRFEVNEKSTAPVSLLKNMGTMRNATPENPLVDEPTAAELATDEEDE